MTGPRVCRGNIPRFQETLQLERWLSEQIYEVDNSLTNMRRDQKEKVTAQERE